MGLTGKAGTVLAGGVPVALAAVDALEPWVNPAMANLTLSDKLRHTIAGPTNNLTTGFGLGAALPTTFGAVAVANSMSSASGGYLKTTAAGLTLVVVDGVIGAIYRFAARGRARGRLMGRQLVSG